jgi:hypothetical protein
MRLTIAPITVPCRGRAMPLVRASSALPARAEHRHFGLSYARIGALLRR